MVYYNVPLKLIVLTRLYPDPHYDCILVIDVYSTVSSISLVFTGTYYGCCYCSVGRDPLAYTQHKPDICAVASTLKAYFRELSTPLFPSDKYRDFINCTRHPTVQDRLDAIQQTVNMLPPPVISVMKYLFRFLSRVAQFSGDNKMGTANLALVFGPTLMRAPDAIDPRQLHTDVPSVNILIQLCIEHNPLIYGDEDEEDEEEDDQAKLRIEQQQNRSKSPPALAPEPPNDLEASFELISKVTVLSTSPPTEPARPPSSLVPQPRVSPEEVQHKHLNYS